MPKVITVTARKEYKCSKCGAEIHKGEKYKKGVCNFKKPRIVCNKCNLYWWELSSSEYVQRTQGLIHYLQDYETPDEIIDELEEIKTTLEDNLENMPENLRENSNSGQTLQEYIDNLDCCISELESIDTEDENWRNEFIECMGCNL